MLKHECRAHPAFNHGSHLLLKCKVATSISYWLKIHSMWFKNYIFTKSVLWSVFGFTKYKYFIILSHFIIVPYLTLWMLDFFNTIKAPNNLDLDHARHFVEPDLGPSYLQRLSADDKSRATVSRQIIKFTEQLPTTTFWIKPFIWLELFSFGLRRRVPSEIKKKHYSMIFPWYFIINNVISMTI